MGEVEAGVGDSLGEGWGMRGGQAGPQQGKEVAEAGRDSGVRSREEK